MINAWKKTKMGAYWKIHSVGVVHQHDEEDSYSLCCHHIRIAIHHASFVICIVAVVLTSNVAWLMPLLHLIGAMVEGFEELIFILTLDRR